MREDGSFELVGYGKAPPEWERRGDPNEPDPLEGFESVEGKPSLSITRPQGVAPGDEVFLRVKGRVKASQTADGKRLEIEMSDVRLDDQ